MSAQFNTNASQLELFKPIPRRGDWSLPGWRLIAPPAIKRYLRLQQRAKHFEARQCDWAIRLIRLNAQTHPAYLARVERIAQRAGEQAVAALDAMLAARDDLRDQP